MFEKEISSYAFNIARRYTGDRISLRTVMADPELPENFKKFAEAEVDEIIDDEEFGKSKSGRLDLSSSEIQTLFKEIRHAIKNAFEFTREDFLDLTDKASKFLFNYVIRPRWTLEKFLFKGEREISRSNFYRAERFLCNYPYYSKGIIEYMEFHDKDSIDLEGWKKLHAKIDEHLIGTLQTNIESLMSPLSELFAFAAGYFKVPTDALVLFLRDKSASEVVDRVEFAKDVRGMHSLDYRDFESILQAPSKDITQTVELPRPQSDSSMDYQSYERRAAAERHMEKVEPDGKGEKKKEQEAKTPGFSSLDLDRQLPMELPQAKGTGKGSPSVRTLLDAKDESKIIKRIFRGSRSLYHIAIHKLDESPDWKSASSIVEGIFIESGVDPFSKYAVAFTDAISKKFNNGSHA
jgi:hypothetical protein